MEPFSFFSGLDSNPSLIFMKILFFKSYLDQQ